MPTMVRMPVKIPREAVQDPKVLSLPSYSKTIILHFMRPPKHGARLT